MEKQIKIPEFKTLTEMADFWDTHSLTEFEDHLVEVKEPIFEHLRDRRITVTLDEEHYQRLQVIAEHEQLSPVSLVNEWVIQQIEEKQAVG